MNHIVPFVPILLIGYNSCMVKSADMLQLAGFPRKEVTPFLRRNSLSGELGEFSQRIILLAKSRNGSRRGKTNEVREQIHADLEHAAEIINSSGLHHMIKSRLRKEFETKNE